MLRLFRLHVLAEYAHELQFQAQTGWIGHLDPYLASVA